MQTSFCLYAELRTRLGQILRIPFLGSWMTALRQFACRRSHGMTSDR
jgi:hypothetical protein